MRLKVSPGRRLTWLLVGITIGLLVLLVFRVAER